MAKNNKQMWKQVALIWALFVAFDTGLAALTDFSIIRRVFGFWSILPELLLIIGAVGVVYYVFMSISK